MSRWLDEHPPGGEAKPFLAHLEDLRTVLLRCAMVITVGVALAIPLTPWVLGLLRAPLEGLVPDPARFLRSLEVVGAFSASIRIALWLGMIFASPGLVAVLGNYLLPALTPVERKAATLFTGGGVVLFGVGVWMGYRFTLPFALAAMLQLHGWLGVEAEWTLSSYVVFTSQLLIAFGLAFELPVLVLVLGRLGFVSSSTLRTYRRHAIVGILILAAILTPPDVFSQMMLAIPLTALFEGCIWIIRAWERSAERGRAQPSEGVPP